MSVLRTVRLVSVTALVLFASISAYPQTTSFTYQGNLSDNSQPASGNYDFEFLLFDSLEGGAQVGDTILRSGVQVNDGRFSVVLDFGAQFPGNDRYLEIRVASSSAEGAERLGSMTTLAPRQPITSVPYAIKSVSADVASTAADAEKLGGIASTEYVLTTDSRMTDARPPTAGSGEYIQNSQSLQPSSYFNISGTGKAAAFSADRFDAITEYEIGGNRVLGAFGQNTFTGIEAGLSLENGALNSLFGYRAGFLNTDGSENSMFGAYAGASNTTGASNSFFGHIAGNSNSTGSLNSFFGSQSGRFNTLGSSNSYFGNLSGYSNTEGSRNSFFGSEAGFSNLGGGDNSFFGTQAGRANVGGAGNSFFGYRSGFNNTNGSYNSYFGIFSGIANTTGTENSFFGSYAGSGNTIGASNTFVGYRAGFSNSEATGNSFFGAGAGENAGFVSSGHSNTFLGRNAGNLNTVGSGNTLVGFFAFAANQEGQDNTAVGTAAGANGAGNANAFFGNLSGYNSTGNFNTFIGSGAGGSSQSGGYNSSLGAGAGPDQPALNHSTAIGAEARVSSSNTIQLGRADGSDTVFVPGSLSLNGPVQAPTLDAVEYFSIGGNQILSVTGDHSTYLGFDSGTAVTSGTDNSFFGAEAGLSNDSGYRNSFFGRKAGSSNTSGYDNTYFGYSAGGGGTGTVVNSSAFGSSAGRLSTGSDNSFFGGKAAYLNTSGGSNTFIGANSGVLNVSGSANTFVGSGSGATNVGGSNNTTVGRGSDVAAADLEFATAVGANAIATASNTIQLGRDGQDKVRVGALGSAGTTSLCQNPSNEIATCSSSIRYKSNVESFRSGSNILERLRPVTFSWKESGGLDIGLVAEEVADVDPLLVTFNTKGEVEGVKYDRIGVVLVNVVKEQQRSLEIQNEKLKVQNERIGQLEAQLAALKALVCASNPDASLCNTKELKQDLQDR